jgi:hypothetical protein
MPSNKDKQRKRRKKEEEALMSATKSDHCTHCGREVDLASHFVYERNIFISSIDGEEFAATRVHPCVFQFEEDYQYGPISKEDIAHARLSRAIDQTSYKSSGIQTRKAQVSPKRKKGNL